MTHHAQLAVIDRARTELPKDERVLGVFLIGSHASGEDDAYSDVDVHVVIADDAADSFRADFARVLEDLAGPLVLADPIPGLIGGLGITEDWLHVDLIAHPLSEYEPADYEAVLPLFDRTGDLLPPARRPAAEHGEPYFPLPAVNLFFYFLGNLVTVLGRDERVVGNSGIVAVRDQLVKLMRAERGVRRTGGLKRLNTYLSTEQRAFLESIPAAGTDPADIVAANRVICAEFIRRGRALAENTKAAWPDRLEEATLRRLRDHFGVEFG
ncbi:nucleotidyltransferase domain-containing protein [Phytomonospora endophytica]|uniref:Putative nucleotidyltransferase n=1 Tax=Phytomonospora endophytica TaxID=714109 RepID=A0A841FH93_9ACTN|nr:nucleotidyltransferase domain-containing protein [Phytomonospora endophytica]MBB6035095.1 putative nucleotidyltransferase [Phytomonospora endophytica]